MTESTTPRVAIIGAGFGGICLAIALRRVGIDTFTLYEKASGIGGTWRDNLYPGAACDSPSHAYSYSFEKKPDWSRKWARQPEILEYIEHCADKYGITDHILLGTAIESARFDEDTSTWILSTSAGATERFDLLVSAVGQLNRPSLPDIPGLADFGGEAFHSASWNHDVDLTGKRVAVIGNAASAVQLVPEIAPAVAQLFIFQRSANWLVPKNDYAYSDRAKTIFRLIPLIALLYRWWLWFSYEVRHAVIAEKNWATTKATKLALEHLRDQIDDPELRDVMTPDYPIGAKRILISDDYYPAVQRENVRVVTDGIERVTARGLVTRTGEAIEVDVLVLATGFETTSFLVPMEIIGPGGQSLHEAWKDGAEAFLGLSVAGFPNFFTMYGPNTNLGHNSIIFMLECQTRYITDALKQMTQKDVAEIRLRPSIMRAYNEEIQRDLDHTVWARIDASWYKNSSGRITNNWPGTTAQYWWRTRRADLALYECRLRDESEPTTARALARPRARF